MLHRLTLRSPIASSSRSVSGDSIEASWTFLATTTSPLLGSHAQVLGGVDAADAGTAEAVPRAAGVFTWTKLCARCCPDAALLLLFLQRLELLLLLLFLLQGLELLRRLLLFELQGLA
jgi:hypothetical protein